MELGIPRDCFELMYRLGQKTSTFHNVNVEFFAPYLLKDGMVQRVTQYKGDSEDEEESTIEDNSEDYEEEDLSEFEASRDEEEEQEGLDEATDDYEEEEGEGETDKEEEEESKEEEKEAPEEPTKVSQVEDQKTEKLEIARPPQVVHVMEKFRHRLDKMNVRETFPLSDKVIERFTNGRKDRLQEHEFFKVGAAILGGEAEDVSKYFSSSRMDGLTKRVWKDMELIEEYTGRPDNLIHMDVQFVHIEKKFGPAGDARGAREIGKITEKYEMKSSKPKSSIDVEDEKTVSPGRILDTVHGIMERSFDIDGRRILLKFHREKGQIFCKSVEFLEPQERVSITAPAPSSTKNGQNGSDNNSNNAVADTGQKEPELRPDDVKVYLVDPRDEKPCLRELSDIYKEQMELQKEAIKRVAVIEKEMDVLLESRMKELSANDMEVWVFDTKRNTHVQKGRLEQEQQIRKKEESILDLELDFLAPYFQRYADVSSLTKAQALEIREECLANIRLGLEDKEAILSDQIQGIKEDMRLKKDYMSQDEIRSKRFMSNVLETRLARQKRETIRILTQAEKKIKNDPRLLDVLGY